MRQQLKEASISIDKTVDGKDWRAYAKYTQGHGFDIDILSRVGDGGEFKRVAMRNAAWPSSGEGDRDIALVSETLDAVADGRAVGNTYFF